MTAYLFVGPTGFGLSAAKLTNGGELVLRRPIRRGDVERLAANETPGTIVICDGTFHHYPAVGHAEIRDAIRQGWQIWGLGSMGAIRAAELHPHGMRGWGVVYRRFLDDPDFTDDEVTLLHDSEAPFTPRSEPLIHLRLCATEAVARALLTPAAAAAVCSALFERWYAERTVRTFSQLVLSHVPAAEVDLRDLVQQMDRFRIKTHDLVSFLERRPWASPTSA